MSEATETVETETETEQSATKAPEASKTPEPSKPSDAEAKLLKDLMKAKTALKEREAALKAFEGIDVEQVRTLLAEREENTRRAAEAEEERLRKAGEFDTLKKSMQTAHAAELEAERNKAKAETERVAKLARTIEELTVGSAFANSQFLRDDTVLTASKARRVYGAHFDVVDGVITPFNRERGEDGREPLVDGAGTPLAFDLAMKAIIEADVEKDQLLKNKTRTGTGTTPAPGKAPAGSSDANLTPLDRIRLSLPSLVKDEAKSKK